MALSFTFFTLLQRHTTPTLTLQQRAPPVDSTPHADSMLPAPVPEGSLSPAPASNLVVYLLLYHQHPARPPVASHCLHPPASHPCTSLPASCRFISRTTPHPHPHSSCHIAMVLLFIVLRGAVIISSQPGLVLARALVDPLNCWPPPHQPPDLRTTSHHAGGCAL